jgi:hypothetical protein
MKKSLIAIILFSLTFIACEEDKLIDITDQCKFENIIFGECFTRFYNYGQDQIVITNNETYLIFCDSVRVLPYSPNCDSATPEIINFTQYSLLAVSTGGGGCDAYYERKILKDIQHKKIIYKIKARYTGECMAILSSWNWVLIPKIEEGYSVEFLQ